MFAQDSEGGLNRSTRGEKKGGYIIYNLLSSEISSKVYLSFGAVNINEETNTPHRATRTGEGIGEADFIVCFNTVRSKQGAR